MRKTYYFCTCPKDLYKQKKFSWVHHNESVRELSEDEVCKKEGICLNCEHYAIAYTLTEQEYKELTDSHLAKMRSGVHPKNVITGEQHKAGKKRTGNQEDCGEDLYY